HAGACSRRRIRRPEVPGRGPASGCFRGGRRASASTDALTTVFFGGASEAAELAHHVVQLIRRLGTARVRQQPDDRTAQRLRLATEGGMPPAKTPPGPPPAPGPHASPPGKH